MITRSVDRDALLLWLGSRAGLLVATVLGVPWRVYADRWQQWDAGLFVTIARYGYDGDPAGTPDPGLPAFFPGLPAALRLVHLVVPDWAVSGLLVSLAAGAVAMVALARLAELEGARGWIAVLALLLFPTAVFLAAGYSESLFLAFAVPAWLAARQGRWPEAALLAAGASCVRITGLFLAVALAVEYVTSRAPLRRAAWLAVPFLPLAAYSAYHYARSGDWLAWKHAQEAGWGREMVWPWQAWRTTWEAATGGGDHAVAFRMEIAGAVVAVAALVWLLALRRWSEAVYTGLQAVALMTSAYYLSIPRALLLWFPMWVAFAGLATRRRWVIAMYAMVAGPLMLLATTRFLQGGWAG
ncbi:mannosyltransferase family protein [Nonomuraea pusilla]|uniref:Mannosyltransferase (PIG-V) n=1 Tax=Nonomuraea pusilla TaxID=46177 RepID=A0A1H8DK10_9ACTN|nr:mannosyltransferase family protein [Nonomuraea pusilla]SEN07682.1 Mannosyltransferase (PIG-V) [Nonomuraea pusilla]